MSENFTVPETERTGKLYREARSPQELFEIAVRELHEQHAAEDAAAEMTRPAPEHVASTTMEDRPPQWRASETWYRVFYDKDGSRYELIKHSQKEFDAEVTKLLKSGWVTA